MKYLEKGIERHRSTDTLSRTRCRQMKMQSQEVLIYVTTVILALQITMVTGSAHIRVRVSNFEGDGRRADGRKCDQNFFWVECDPQFEICITDDSHGNYSNWDAAAHNCFLNEDTRHYHDENNVYGSIVSLAGTRDSWHGATVWIWVEDADDWNGDDHIETFKQSLFMRPYQEADDSRETTLVPTSGIHRSSNHITISFDVYCLADYYSATCGVYCVEQDSETDGHYTCHPMDGYKMCRPDYYDNTTVIPCSTPVLNCEEEGLGFCKNGTCVNQEYNFTCSCSPGWGGEDCSRDVDECLSDPCQNGGNCSNLQNSYICSCPPAYTGTNCESDICDVENPCKNTGVCLGALQCNCSEFYSGDTCDQCNCLNKGDCSGDSCTCKNGYTGTFCETNIDDCVDHKCENGGRCIDHLGGYSCHCVETEREAFTGYRCEKLICDFHNPCENGGVCYKHADCECPSVSSGEHCETCHCVNGTCDNGTCQCTPGFTGDLCDVNINECDPNPCENNGTCEDGINSYNCICSTTDYYKHYTGSMCQDVVCDIRNLCENGGTCYGNGSCECMGSYGGDRCEVCRCAPNGKCQGDTCDCDTGYTGMYCETEINECSSDPCQNGGTCEDLVGRFHCECPVSVPGTTGVGTSEHSYTGSQCEHTVCNLTQPCVNGECYGSGQCYCGGVYSGASCETCLCQNNGTCDKSSCNCVPGYTGIHCESEIDECATQPCKNGGNCTDLLNGYSCLCLRNEEHVYVGTNCEKTVCQERNPCGHGQCYGDGLCRCERIYDDGVNCTTCFCVNGTCGETDCACTPGFTGDLCETEINECGSSPCKNGGTCVDGINHYNCTCPEAFMGINCQISKCEDYNPCKHGGVCYGDRQCECGDIYTGATCEGCRCANGACQEGVCDCDPGWKGEYCDIEIDECLPGPCRNGGTCNDVINGYSCDCDNSGYHHYTGDECQLTVCSQNNPCKFGGTCYGDGECGCMELYSGVTCEQCLCIHGDCVAADCQCDPGYTGKFCETEIDECSSSPCLNGGRCMNHVNSYSCDCSQIPGPDHYTGDRCQFTKCSLNNSCQHDSVCYGDSQCRCSDIFSGNLCETCRCVKGLCSAGSCLCQAGFTGSLCETDVDDCESSPCLNGGECIDKVNAFECRCNNSGFHHYTGDTCHSTICSTKNECGDRGTCYADGKCECLDVYEGEVCRTCKCENGYCDGGNCICYAGYEGKLCDQDINECASDPCQNGGSCKDGINGYTCDCSTDPNHTIHYTGTHCEISQCSITNVCKNGGTCYRTSECLCPEMYTGAECETCLCDSGSCALGGESCDCNPGFTGGRCDVDLCDIVRCLNGGTCRAGECACTTGFGGIHCGERTTPSGSENIIRESISGGSSGTDGTILGIVFGFIVLVVLVVLAALYCRRRNKRTPRNRTMSTQAIMEDADEQTDGTQTEIPGENVYENVGEARAIGGIPPPIKKPLPIFKPPAYLPDPAASVVGQLPAKTPLEEKDGFPDDPDDLPDIVPANPPLLRSLSDQSALQVVPQRTGFPGNSVNGRRRGSLAARGTEPSENPGFAMSGTAWNPAYKRRDSANMYTNC